MANICDQGRNNGLHLDINSSYRLSYDAVSNENYTDISSDSTDVSEVEVPNEVPKMEELKKNQMKTKRKKELKDETLEDLHQDINSSYRLNYDVVSNANYTDISSDSTDVSEVEVPNEVPKTEELKKKKKKKKKKVNDKPDPNREKEPIILKISLNNENVYELKDRNKKNTRHTAGSSHSRSTEDKNKKKKSLSGETKKTSPKLQTNLQTSEYQPPIAFTACLKRETVSYLLSCAEPRTSSSKHILDSSTNVETREENMVPSAICQNPPSYINVRAGLPKRRKNSKLKESNKVSSTCSSKPTLPTIIEEGAPGEIFLEKRNNQPKPDPKQIERKENNQPPVNGLKRKSAFVGKPRISHKVPTEVLPVGTAHVFLNKRMKRVIESKVATYAARHTYERNGMFHPSYQGKIFPPKGNHQIEPYIKTSVFERVLQNLRNEKEVSNT